MNTVLLVDVGKTTATGLAQEAVAEETTTTTAILKNVFKDNCD
jgi:hypothetical protein